MNPNQPTAATATTATDDQEEEEEEGGERYSVAAVAPKKRHVWNIPITVFGIELIRHTSECSRFQGGGGDDACAACIDAWFVPPSKYII